MAMGWKVESNAVQISIGSSSSLLKFALHFQDCRASYAVRSSCSLLVLMMAPTSVTLRLCRGSCSFLNLIFIFAVHLRSPFASISCIVHSSLFMFAASICSLLMAPTSVTLRLYREPCSFLWQHINFKDSHFSRFSAARYYLV